MLSEMKFNVVDLFAGCGGLSEGFKQAGFNVIAQLEMDPWACETLRTRNIYHQLMKTRRSHWYRQLMMGYINRDEILKELPEMRESLDHTIMEAEFGRVKLDEILLKFEESRKSHGASTFNVVIGGPPCQPYSLVGRSRDPYRMELDSRHFLYEYYLEILGNIQPDFFVFENVPGLMTATVKGEEIFSKMLDDFRDVSPSYEIAPSFDEYSKNPRQFLLDSNKYGVPQKRKRVVFIGYKRNLLNKNPDIKHVFRKILKQRPSRYWGYDVSSAIGDLPPLKPGEGNDQWYGWYPQKEITPYQQIMRKYSPGIINHKARTHMASDLERYRFFIEYHLNGHGAATLVDLINKRPDLTPEHKQHNLDKFVDRFKVQWWNRPASTITAHICKDGHYYIHPDINQCRSFTVREAARCQSFPDNFKFEGPRTEQFRQVGNAVPPMLAYSIARAIMMELKKVYE